MIKKIYVFGNMGKMNQLPKSGGQTSARRVIQGFRDYGFDVIPIRRHRAELQSKIGHIFEVGYFAFYDLAKMVGMMLFGSRRNVAFMQFTYAGTLVPYEIVLTLTAKLLGYKCMSYLQGGLMMDWYPQASSLSRYLYEKNLNIQSAVLFEGLDALKQAESFTINTQLIYFPSYVFDDRIPDGAPVKPKCEINFCYFGRVCKVKNVLISLEIYNRFCSLHRGLKTSFTIVGSGEDRRYQQSVKEAIKTSPFSETIKWYGNSPYEFLVEMMQDKHFYLFPTIEKAEGHSNALNEAMSQGVIPIASDYHFNKSIIGEDILVVKGYNPDDYVKAINNVVDNVDMVALSRKLHARVRDNYTYSKVNRMVCEQICKL